MGAMMRASWDGDVPMIVSDGHVYLPTQWLAGEYPRDRDLYLAIERRVKRELEKHP